MSDRGTARFALSPRRKANKGVPAGLLAVEPGTPSEEMLQEAVHTPQAEARSAILAKFHGGPYDGVERMIFRLRTDYMRRVRRGRVRRMLKRPPRYAWYQLVGIEPDTGDAHYVFRGVRTDHGRAKGRALSPAA